MLPPNNPKISELDRLHAERASRWIEILKTATPEQRKEFVAWFKESPRNVRDILYMLTVDETLNGIDPNRIHDVEALVAEAGAQVVAFPSPHPVAQLTAGGRPRFRWLAIAASLIVFLASAGIYRAFYYSPWTSYRTATSEQRAFDLGDGTVINLNTHSHVMVRYSEGVARSALNRGRSTVPSASRRTPAVSRL